MGTPTNILETLVPAKKLEYSDWIKLVEARRSTITKHLKNFTLPTLESVKCLQTETFEHEISLTQPKLTEGSDFSLNIQGIFSYSFESRKTIPNSGFQSYQGRNPCPDGSLYVWGLARTGDWLVAEVKFKGQNGYKDRGFEGAYEVSTKKVDIGVLLETAKVTPQKVYNRLGEMILFWYQNRASLLSELEEILTQARFVDELINFQNNR